MNTIIELINKLLVKDDYKSSKEVEKDLNELKKLILKFDKLIRNLTCKNICERNTRHCITHYKKLKEFLIK